MNKAELVSAIAEEAQLTKVDADKALTGILDALTNCLAAGDKVTLVGFGTFSVAERAARTGQNPQTGKKIEIAASTAPKFKPGNTLKELLNA
ncbi:HU family DNA-binding protein [Geomonas paludis]|uniref:HU family DNA-binding protein n=1 Tax=Geomonas paludis TaxID=2740185 RepID=A0A6V8MYH2_9BACT|nr:HU family DNA-binding protein [Geomonas paludis]UPU37274.1 HU family DNA-binding protein [Geomonas paludis]GFO65171.1 transcriptional regulator [Geomonas paludis]